jgi:hypothetical protein
MSKKLTGRALGRLEAGRDIWQEVLDGVRGIKEGGGKRFEAEPRSPIVEVRLRSGPAPAQSAALMGVSWPGARPAARQVGNQDVRVYACAVPCTSLG